MPKFLCWRNNSRLSFEQSVISHKSFTVEEVAVILSLVDLYSSAFDWAAFKLLKIGDEKYTFVFQLVGGIHKIIKVWVK